MFDRKDSGVMMKLVMVVIWLNFCVMMLFKSLSLFIKVVFSIMKVSVYSGCVMFCLIISVMFVVIVIVMISVWISVFSR